MARKVIKVIKEKENLVRDAIKKCLVAYGLKETIQPVKNTREKIEKNKDQRFEKTSARGRGRFKGKNWRGYRLKRTKTEY